VANLHDNLKTNMVAIVNKAYFAPKSRYGVQNNFGALIEPAMKIKKRNSNNEEQK